MDLKGHISNSKKVLIQTSNLPNDKKLTEYRNLYEERIVLSKKLEAEDWWYGILNIYYSCFTLILGVISLTDLGKFLSLPSVLFTIVLTYLVIYSNGQRHHARSVDLRANCTDFEKLLYDADYTVCSFDKSQNNHDNLSNTDEGTSILIVTTDKKIDKILKDIADKCTDLKKDSESPVDKWNDLEKASQRWILFLLIVPILYVITCACFNYDNLYLFFRNPK